jgi:hypothetical protein
MYNLFDKQVIFCYQGNSMLIEITLTDTETGEPIPVENDDYVLFTVSNKNNNIVIQKKLTQYDYDSEDECLHCNLDSNETADLPTGEYYYDCLYVCGTQSTTFISSSLVITKAYGKVATPEPDENGGDTSGE